MIDTSLDLGQVTGNTNYVTSAGVLPHVQVYTQSAASQLTYQTTNSQYIGAAATAPIIPGVTDVTQMPWGGQEPYGCFVEDGTDGSCQWTNGNYTNGPYIDGAVTDADTSAVTIALPWNSVEPSQGTYDFFRADQEVASAAAKGDNVILQPEFQVAATGSSTCTLSGQSDVNHAAPQFLPSWESGRVLMVCDSATNDGIWVPDYWNSTFQTDWLAFVAEVASHYSVDCPSNPNQNTTLCTTKFGGTQSGEFQPSYVLYVRGGSGLYDEGSPYDRAASTNVLPQLKTWAAQTPGSETCKSPQNSSLPANWQSWQECILSIYTHDFYYSSVMYPVVDPAGESLSSVATAEWAMQQGLSVGQDGFAPYWADGPSGDCSKDDPGNPCGTIEPDMQNLNAYYNTHTVYPPFVELQTYESMTQDCTGTYVKKYLGGDVACSPYSVVVCNSTTSDGNGCADPSGYYKQCAAANAKDNTYLAQSAYYSMTTTLEVYFNDLENPNSGVVAAYHDWTTGTSPGDQSQLWPSGKVCPVGGY